MNVNTYDKNQTVRLSARFEVSGADTDPTTITLMVKNLYDAAISYTFAGGEVSKLTTGRYYRDVKLNHSGDWFYRWEGTGTVEAAAEKTLHVNDSEF